MIDLSALMLTAFYAAFGILLMIVSNIVIDFFIPGDFAEEIRRGNRAVAWLSAGSFIGIGEILRAVIISPASDAMALDFVQGVVASIVYAAAGILFFIIGFFVINAWHRKYKLAAEIRRGNTAAGIFVFGIFVGLSLVISGAVH
ncbi:MAG: DUF350 domain-containing protein [Centipeda sp. (in: firmicutes)]